MKFNHTYNTVRLGLNYRFNQAYRAPEIAPASHAGMTAAHRPSHTPASALAGVVPCGVMPPPLRLDGPHAKQWRPGLPLAVSDSRDWPQLTETAREAAQAGSASHTAQRRTRPLSPRSRAPGASHRRSAVGKRNRTIPPAPQLLRWGNNLPATSCGFEAARN